MASGTPTRVRAVMSPATERSDASDVIGAGLESPSPAVEELEAQEVSRVKRRRLLRQTTSEAEWMALMQRGKQEVDKKMEEQSTESALAKLMAGCELSTSAASSRDPVADSRTASSSCSAATSHGQQQ